MKKFNVTQKHIDAGEYQDPFSCPIALSLKEQGYQCTHVGDDVTTAGTCNDGRTDNREDYQHDYLVSKWIANYDNQEKVYPFEFTLDSINKVMYMSKSQLNRGVK